MTKIQRKIYLLIEAGYNTKNKLVARKGYTRDQITSAINNLTDKKEIIQCGDENGQSIYEVSKHDWLHYVPANEKEYLKQKHITNFEEYAKIFFESNNINCDTGGTKHMGGYSYQYFLNSIGVTNYELPVLKPKKIKKQRGGNHHFINHNWKASGMLKGVTT